MNAPARKLPLEGLRVVEFTHMVMGPTCGMVLADLGAEVIKVEPPAGDNTRRLLGSGAGFYPLFNRNKKSLVLDLQSPEGQEAVLRLIATADVVSENFKPGTMKKLGLDYDTLKALNPKLIYATLTGFGADDSRTAFDVVLQAEAGLMYMNGTPESGPVKWPVAVVDLMAAHQLKEGILLALLQRERTGQGAKVSVSLYDAAVASLANSTCSWRCGPPLRCDNSTRSAPVRQASWLTSCCRYFLPMQLALCSSRASRMR